MSNHDQEREAFEAAFAGKANFERNEFHPEHYAHLPARQMWDAWQARASVQPAGVEFEPDRVCEDADGCPTERAVLKRFWRKHRAQELSGPIREAIKWSEHLLFECGALTHTRAPSVHVYNKTFAAVEAAKAMLAAAPHPVSGEQKPVAVLRYQRRSTGLENEMPAVISCNDMPDGDHAVYATPPAAQDVSALVSALEQALAFSRHLPTQTVDVIEAALADHRDQAQGGGP